MVSNKFFLLMALVVVLVFYFGYRVGDARGYSDGLDDGSTYDCRADVVALQERLNVVSRNIENTARVVSGRPAVSRPSFTKASFDSVFTRKLER